MCPTTVPPQIPGTGFRMRVEEYQCLVFPVPFLEKQCVKDISIPGGKGEFEWLNWGSWSEIAEDTMDQVLWWAYCMAYILNLEGNRSQEGRFMQRQASEIPAAQLFCWKTRCARHLRVSIWRPSGFDLLETPQEHLKLWFLCIFAHAVCLTWDALPSYPPPHLLFFFASPSNKFGAPPKSHLGTDELKDSTCSSISMLNGPWGHWVPSIYYGVAAIIVVGAAVIVDVVELVIIIIVTVVAATAAIVVPAMTVHAAVGVITVVVMRVM